MSQESAVPAAGAAVPDATAVFQIVSVPPPWLTQDYFQTALREFEKDKNLEVKIFLVIAL